MEQTRMNLTVDTDIPELLTELAGGERKRGEWLSALVRRLHAARTAQPVRTNEPMDLQAAALVELERRVSELERRVGQ